jgi:hypothetical protein
MDFQTITLTAPSAEASGSPSNTDDDLALLALETQFNALTAELTALQSACNSHQEIACCSDDRPSAEEVLRSGAQDLPDQDAKVEAILARLYPVERAIMTTPARSIDGLGVKARHAAHVMSEYWTAPVAQIDWDAQVVRHLIESVCSLANVRLPFCGPDKVEQRVIPGSDPNRLLPKPQPERTSPRSRRAPGGHDTDSTGS